MSLDDRIIELRATLEKQEQELREALQEKNLATAEAFLQIAAETPWTLVGHNLHGSCRLVLSDKEDSPTNAKFRAIWKHDYHDSLEIKDLEIRFDDWEYSISAIRRSDLSNIIKIAERYNIKIVDTISEEISNREKEIRNLEKARKSLEHLFV